MTSKFISAVLADYDTEEDQMTLTPSHPSVHCYRYLKEIDWTKMTHLWGLKFLDINFPFI